MLEDHVWNFVKIKHAGQYRKSGELVINHLIEVASITMILLNELEIFDQKEKFLLRNVALLHDVLEDTPTTIKELSNIVSLETIQYIEFLTEDGSLPYIKRKKAYLQQIRTAPLQVKIIKLADIYSGLKTVHNFKNDSWAKKYTVYAKRILVQCMPTTLKKTSIYKKSMQIIIEF